ncbi:hypothetical protein D3C72_2141130 [compost metagenome]
MPQRRPHIGIGNREFVARQVRSTVSQLSVELRVGGDELVARPLRTELGLQLAHQRDVLLRNFRGEEGQQLIELDAFQRAVRRNQSGGQVLVGEV